MFGISSFEFLVILLIAVVVLGPERLPKIMLKVTKIISEFRKISTDLQRTVNAEIHLHEHNELKKEAEKELFGNNAEQKVANPGEEAALSAPAVVLPAEPEPDAGQTQPAHEGTEKNGEKSELDASVHSMTSRE